MQGILLVSPSFREPKWQKPEWITNIFNCYFTILDICERKEFQCMKSENEHWGHYAAAKVQVKTALKRSIKQPQQFSIVTASKWSLTLLAYYRKIILLKIMIHHVCLENHIKLQN